MDFKAERLYTGFVNSYNGLLLAVGSWAEGVGDRAGETHAFINWFWKTGLAYGYYPKAERLQRDLEWFDEDNDRPVLHLESENDRHRFIVTIDKLLGSDAKLRVALVWTDLGEAEVEAQIERVVQASEHQDWTMLLIIRQWHGEEDDADPRRGAVYYYDVTGKLVSDGTATTLTPWIIEWPERSGFQLSRWNE
ncbi:MAG: hypothetical protein ABIO70_06265 [Pseudomonadota bacterium]